MELRKALADVREGSSHKLRRLGQLRAGTRSSLRGESLSDKRPDARGLALMQIVRANSP
jgi:hypothetical protein